jgi:hypothetical protein
MPHAPVGAKRGGGKAFLAISTQLSLTAISKDSLNSIPLLSSSFSFRLASRNSTDLNELIFSFYNPSARTAKKTASLFVRRCVFNSSLLSNCRTADHTENNAFLLLNAYLLNCSIAMALRVTSHIVTVVACGHYLATAVSLASQFLLCANTPQ